MPVRLDWVVHAAPSYLHAAAASRTPRAGAESPLLAAVAEPAAKLDTLAAAAGIDPGLLLDHLVPLSTGIPNPRELAEVALRKSGGPSAVAAHTQPLSAVLGELYRAGQAVHADLEHDLRLRAGPLRELWEARGSGLLRLIGGLTDRDLLPESARVLLVQPVLGGGGQPHLGYNAVRIEAVLANPIEGLPEVARLGWLLSTLNLDLGRFADRLRRDRLSWIGPLALIPAALAAASQVELTGDPQAALSRAVEHWFTGGWLPPPRGSAESLADALDRWWRVYQAAPPPWNVALEALDRLLA